MADKSVKKQFEKSFELASSDQNYDLPPREKWLSNSCVSLKKFVELREDLNAVKSLLNHMPLTKWRKHTRNQNPAGFVTTEVRNVANPELLTQAWCKFTEILWKFPFLVPESSQDFQSLHLCEAPGAFITALNHFIRVNRPSMTWSWTGTTLNPYYEGNTTGSMINDDRFILHTLDHWDFCPDNTGDLLDPSNLKYFTQNYRNQMHLITADGSIDCQKDPARQEALVLDLHFSEILASLGALRREGHLVIKMFTFYEWETICHLYLLSSLFVSVDVYKPATSKEGNSEVYVVCQSFKDISMTDIEAMIEGLSKKESLFSTEDIGEDFVETVYKCAAYFKDIQVSVIKGNIELFKHKGDKELQSLKTAQKKEVVKKFLSDFNIKKIENSDRIVKNMVCSHVDDCRQADERVEFGTFQDRCQEKSEEEKLKNVIGKLSKLHPSWLPVCRKVEWISLLTLKSLPDFRPLSGKPFSQIQSSKFCPCRAINLYKESLRIKESQCAIRTMAMKKRRLDLIKFHPIKSLLVQTPILAKLAKIYPEVLTLPTFVVKVDNSECLENSQDNLSDTIGQLVSVLSEMERGQHLIVLNFMLLTRLQLTLFYILVHNFEEVGFLRPVHDSHGIFLSEFKGNEMQWKTKLNEMNSYFKDHRGLLSLISVEYLTQEPLYSMIVAHNINIMRETSKYLLKI